MSFLLEFVLCNRRRSLLIIIFLCVLSHCLYSFLDRHSAIKFVASFAKDVKTRGLSSVMSQLDTFLSDTNETHYTFVAFKKKPLWHFVKFPSHYRCSKQKTSVSVHLADNPVDIVGADVVLFTTGPFTFDEWKDLHHYREPGQLWVFATQEPASIVADFLPPKIYRYSSYNISFTFHSTSDIYGAYGWYTPFKETKKLMTDWYSKKPKLMAWVSSRHCAGMGWDRTKMVLDLGKHLPIDMYGQCGNISLARNVNVVKKAITYYKFFLSLENSCCSEYLTEKVWNALENWESVPIVIGGRRDEYRRFMPPNSYIHVDDFESIRDLARYIKIVSQNASLYNQYFAWRSLGSVHQQQFPERFPVYQQGACKVVEVMKKMQTETPLKRYSFDAYGPNWFGSCFRCGDHEWIQDYIIWQRRLQWSQEWEDNRTLYWRDKL